MPELLQIAGLGYIIRKRNPPKLDAIRIYCKASPYA